MGRLSRASYSTASPDTPGTHLSQDVLVLDDVLVSCEQDVELATAELGHKSAPGGRGALGAGGWGDRTREEWRAKAVAQGVKESAFPTLA